MAKDVTKAPKRARRKVVATTSNNGLHLEIELKVAVHGKSEEQFIRGWLEGQGYTFDKRTLIVDFVEPSRSVTSRVRFEKIIEGAGISVAGCDDVTCYIGKKSHPILGELEDYVREESEPSVDASLAVSMLMRAIQAQRGEPIPYYSKKRRYYVGKIGENAVSIALDKPKGLSKKFGKRFMEVEIQLPTESTRTEVQAVVDSIRLFLHRVFNEDRPTEISYRRMVKKTWAQRKMWVA